MSQYSRTLQFLVWGFLGVVIAAIFVAFIGSLWKRNDAELERQLPVIGDVGSFQLTNQFGKVVTEAGLAGKVWVADIIFTRCPGPCAKMTRRMAEIQKLLPKDKDVRLVSLTTDPAFDTPEILKRYGDRFGADHDQWLFLTGTTNQIRKLAVGGLKLTAEELPPEERESPADLFLHSTIFVIVDRQGKLRGVFDLESTSPQQVVSAVKYLLR